MVEQHKGPIVKRYSITLNRQYEIKRFEKI